LRDAHVQGSRRILYAIDKRDACIRVRDLRLAMESRSQDQYEDDAKPKEPSDAWAHAVRQFWIGLTETWHIGDDEGDSRTSDTRPTTLD